MRRCLRLLAVITSFAPGIVVAQGFADSTRARIDQVFAKWDHTDSPGCALGVSQRGVGSYSRGYGMADLQHALAITPSSIFHVASISKQFAAFAVGLLADDGKLSLDDDFRQYVPELPDFGTRITIRQLIHHVSGLRDQWQLLGYAGWREDDLITEQDVLDILARQKGANFSPGDEWVYSNTGYTLLAVIVKRVSGQTLRQFAERRIFAPLGMNSTHFHDDHTMIVPGRTSAYQPRPSGGWFISIPVFDTYGATSLFTTTGDLLTWMRQLDEPRVGSASLLRDAQTSAQLNNGTPTGYGYGMSIGRYRGLRVVGHGGADAGYRAQIERYPERGISVAVLCNVSTAGPGALARRVVDVLLGDSAPTEGPAVDTTRVASTDHSRGLWTGVYRDVVSHMPLRIRATGDSLTLGDGRVLRLSGDTTGFVAGGGQGFVLHVRGASVTGITQLPKGTRSIEYQREIPAVLAKRQLDEFAGTFESPELDIRYELVVTDSGLTVRARRLETFALEPLWADAFAASFGTVFEFTRNAARKVDGFTIADGRVRGIRFTRVPAAVRE